MSGTAYGIIVLHVTPEAALGRPLALVRNGDLIRLSVASAGLDLLVDDAELERRRAALPAPAAVPATGYRRLFHEHVLGADRGCDFGFCAPPA
jgi:dihydroxy-acid dehydratase